MTNNSVAKQEGSLKISHSVIEKVAEIAALDVNGVKNVSAGTAGIKGIINKIGYSKPVEVKIDDDGIASVEICIVVENGAKIPNVCKDVQRAVKTNVQNITEITVSKVNVVVTGVEETEE